MSEAASSQVAPPFADVGALLLELLEALGPLPSSRAGANLGSALRAALDAVARPPERWSVAEDALRLAARHALALEPAIAPDEAWLAGLAGALDGCIAAQPPLAHLGITPQPPVRDGRLIASLDRPRRWSVDGELARALAVVARGASPPPEDEADPPAGPSSLALDAPGAASGGDGERGDDDADVPRPLRDLAPVDVWTPPAPGAARVTLVEGAAAIIAAPVVAARWAERALDSLAMHLEHRAELPFAAVAAEDERALAFLDAARVDPRGLPLAIEVAWGRHVESADPWAAAAVMLVLSSLHGDAPLRAARDLASSAPATDETIVAMAEGLVLGGSPELAGLARELERSPRATGRALAVELARRIGTLSTDALRTALCDPSPLVACAAARAVGSPEMRALAPLARALLRHPDRSVARAAAVGLTVAGQPDALQRLRDEPAFARALGVTAIDVLALAGDARDVETIAGLARRIPASAALFDALARFGHPRSWLYLSHHLGDEDRADDAASALASIFGALVEPDARTHAPAWRSAIAARRFDPEERLCRGRPWHPSLLRPIADEGAESRVMLERRALDFALRSGVGARPDLSGWSVDRAAALADADAALRARSAVPAGRWLPIPDGGGAP